MRPGVSVVICCHNSAQRLRPTLAHLAAQQAPPGLDWEVIIIDNASTDDTAEVARAAWPADHPAEFRVIPEPQAGLSFARHRGFHEARYDIISFVDDDNWVCPEWVRLVTEVMDAHPEVGACGGCQEEVCEVEPPAWFERHKTVYAVGPQAEAPGVMTGLWECLGGAGMSIRRSAWQQLLDRGFQPLLAGRQGSALTSGEDIEFMYVLRLSGWSLYYEPRMRIRHFIPAGRLQWAYLVRLRRGGGASTVGLDPYSFALLGDDRSFKEQLRRTWGWQMARTLKSLAQYRLKLLFHQPIEGDSNVLEVEHYTGRLTELIRWRKVYAQRIRAVRNTSWKSASPVSGAPLWKDRYEGAAEKA
jgi:glycosyltransferase involved in cell wall biosynthesis